MSLCEEKYGNDEEDGEQESSEEYRKGGYHCVTIGDTFCQQRYQVIRKLGWGSFSTVWLCLDIKADHYVAIKIIKSKKSYHELALQEIQMLSAVERADPTNPLSHRVVTLLDNFITKGVNGRHHCLVFEVLGDSLFNFMRTSFPNGIPIEAIKRIVRQILEGLQYLHTKCKLIHTDIKPENILLTANEKRIEEMHSEVNHLIGICGLTQLPSSFVSSALSDHKLSSDSSTNEDKSIENISNLIQNIGNKTFVKKYSHIFDEELSEISLKIADLGNACHLDGFHSNTIQTRPYRSPEVILGLGFGPSADIWSTACTVFELATGHLLFRPRHFRKSAQNDAHLAKMMELLGPVPKMYRKGKNYTKYFSESGRLLLYKVKRKSSLDKLLVSKYGWAQTVAQSFAEFLSPMLEMDPRKRATPQECLSHEWLNT